MSLSGPRDPHEPEPRHVLEARGGRHRLRGLEGRARRRRGGELRSVARPAVALRELAGGPAARPRRQRAQPSRRHSRVLEPRSSVQRHRRAGRAHPLDAAAQAHRQEPGLRRSGLLELRAGRVPRRRGHELRDAAGHGRRRDAHRHLTRARTRSGADAARAERRRRAARQRVLRVHGRPRPLHGLRQARPDGRDRAPRGRGAATRSLRAERRCRYARLSALRRPSRHRRDARLLERPGRRLPRPSPGRGAPRRDRAGGDDRRRAVALALAPGSARPRPGAGSRRCASSPARPARA